MRILFSFLSCFFLSSFLRAEDQTWENNKITRDQPFSGKVLAVETSWGGYRLLLRSTEDESKFCIAQIWPGGGGSAGSLSYKLVQRKDFPKPSVQWVFLNPAIEVDRFSWSMGPWRIGRIFGDNDCLKIVLNRNITNREQGGADQPATAPELKPEGNSKPKPKSEGRSQ